MAVGFPPSSPRTDAQSQRGVLLVLELRPLLFVSETKSRQSLIHGQNQLFFCVRLVQRRRRRRVLATGEEEEEEKEEEGAIVLIWMNLLWDLKTSVSAGDIPQFYRTAETNRWPGRATLCWWNLMYSEAVFAARPSVKARSTLGPSVWVLTRCTWLKVGLWSHLRVQRTSWRINKQNSLIYSHRNGRQLCLLYNNPHLDI